jgi:hypothetical protein
MYGGIKLMKTEVVVIFLLAIISKVDWKDRHDAILSVKISWHFWWTCRLLLRTSSKWDPPCSRYKWQRCDTVLQIDRFISEHSSQYLITYSLTELSSSWGAANFAATQEFPSILWNPKVHYRVHKSRPLLPILSHISPICTIPSYLRSILILSTHVRLGLPSDLYFWLSHQYPICIPVLPHSCYMPRSFHPSC